MNDEIREILDNPKTLILSYGTYISLNDYFKLRDYITNLQQKIEQYENPGDMTLFYMWLDVKAKDKMKELQKENERLNKEINNKEFVFVGTAQNKTRDFIKHLIREKNDYKSRCEKAIEYINNGEILNTWDNYRPFKDFGYGKDLLNILQNGGEEK